MTKRYMGDERRKFTRTPLRMLITYEVESSIRSDYSADISGGGLFIQTTNPLPVGSTVLVQLAFPNVPRLIEATGRVVRTQEWSEASNAPPGMGIQFVDLKPSDQAFIVQFFWEKPSADKT